METFASLRESKDDMYMEGINAYLRTVKEKGVKVLEARYISEDDKICAEIDMRPYVRDKVEIEFGGSSEYFNVWYHEMAHVRMNADDFVEDWNGLQRVKDAVRDYVKENNIPRYKAYPSNVHDYSFLLNNNGWM